MRKKVDMLGRSAKEIKRDILIHRANHAREDRWSCLKQVRDSYHQSFIPVDYYCGHFTEWLSAEKEGLLDFSATDERPLPLLGSPCFKCKGFHFSGKVMIKLTLAGRQWLENFDARKRRKEIIYLRESRELEEQDAIDRTAKKEKTRLIRAEGKVARAKKARENWAARKLKKAETDE